MHLLPFKGSAIEIVPEGKQHLDRIDDISQLKSVFKKDGKYLFFSIANQMWIVDSKLGGPRFFRDRFAKALGVPERGNWKEMHQNKDIMVKAIRDIESLKSNWKNIRK